jgi:chemotaxis protein CheX
MGIESRRDARPAPPESLRDQLLAPFIEAVSATLREWLGTEVVARTVYHTPLPETLGDISAALDLTSAGEGPLLLSFPRRTAAALAGRALTGTPEQPDEALVRDCMGEIANVVAGQAKALLAGTPHHFTFATPTVVAGGHEGWPRRGGGYLVVLFGSDAGDFALQLGLGS